LSTVYSKLTEITPGCEKINYLALENYQSSLSVSHYHFTNITIASVTLI